MIKTIVCVLLFAFTACAQQRAIEYFGDMPVVVDTALTARFKNTIVYRDSTGKIFFKLNIMPQGDVIAFENGSPLENKGAIIFDSLTQDELDYIISEIRYFEKRKKVKRD